MKSKRIGAVVLQQLLKRTSDLNPWAGQKDAHAPANVAIRFQVVVTGIDRRSVDRIIQIGLGIHRKPTPQHHSVARFSR